MNIAVGKYQRRGQIIRDPFVLQLPEHRKIDGAIGVCKAPPDSHAASVNLSDGTTPEFRGLKQVKWSLSYVDAGSRTPNEPTAHNVWLQRAHEYSYPPERNATLDQPVTQLCDHLIGLHCRSRASDEPIHNRLYVTTSHHTRPCGELRCYASPRPAGLSHLHRIALAAATLDRSRRFVLCDQPPRKIEQPPRKHACAFGELLRVLHDRDIVLHVLVRPAARMRDKRELRKDEAELGEEAKHLASNHLDVVLAADDDEARNLIANEDTVGNRDLVLDAIHPLGHLEIE